MSMTHWLGRAAHNVQSLLNRVALAYGSYPPVGPDYDPVPPRRLPVTSMALVDTPILQA
jgi:hypothetical protein